MKVSDREWLAARRINRRRWRWESWENAAIFVLLVLMLGILLAFNQRVPS